uniref:Uncharacterized protein n=1 Tax=Oryza sativa subsp. japonica TaxID=39947 RepID=Q654E1_ORYSJ|nr:hypothetical protein [Oryza sativa Japonica Group]
MVAVVRIRLSQRRPWWIGLTLPRRHRWRCRAWSRPLSTTSLSLSAAPLPEIAKPPAAQSRLPPHRQRQRRSRPPLPLA